MRKSATFKSSDGLNMQLLIEDHNEAINAAKDNCTTETIEKLEMLCQTLEDKKCYAMEFGLQQQMLM